VPRLCHLLLMVCLGIFVAGCTGGDDGDEQPPDPVALLTEAADNIRSAETFRLDVTQSGAEYPILIELNGADTQVTFRRAQAQYVAPDLMQGSVRVVTGGVTIDIGIFSRGADQWVQILGTNWIKAFFAPGFNPETLIAADTGFQAALSSLTALSYIGEETLDDGSSVYHLSGTAEGPAVSALLVDLIEAEGAVGVEVYIDRTTRYPVRLMISQPETITETQPDPTTWTIDVFDIDAPAQLNPPPEPEATPEATAGA